MYNYMTTLTTQDLLYLFNLAFDIINPENLYNYRNFLWMGLVRIHHTALKLKLLIFKDL